MYILENAHIATINLALRGPETMTGQSGERSSNPSLAAEMPRQRPQRWAPGLARDLEGTFEARAMREPLG